MGGREGTLLILVVCGDAIAEPAEAGEFRPYYAIAEPRARTVGNQARSALVRALEERGLELVVEGTGGDRKRSAQLGDAGTALGLLALQIGRPGAEYDWIAERAPDHVELVSVRWDREQLVIAEGRRERGLERTGPDPSAIERRWGTGPLVPKGRDFEPTTLGMIDDAFGALTDAERALLARLPIHREPLATVGPRAEAVYKRGPKPRIVIFDSALAREDRFVGDVDRPHPVPVRTLMHEIGHALADAPARTGRVLAANLERLAEADAAAAANAPPEAREVLEARRARALAAAEAVFEQAKGPSPVVAAWSTEVATQEPAPTVYGRSAPPEGYADAFSLARLDARALERAAPKAAAWFASGRHVEVANQSIGELRALAARVLGGEPAPEANPPPP